MSLGAWYSDWWWNVTGTVSPDEKEASIQAAAEDLVRASGGQMSMEEALVIARRDITNVLMQRNADPSQAGLTNALAPITPDLDPIGTPLLLLGIGVGVLALVLILRR